jgi:hypothetical protein
MMPLKRLYADLLGYLFDHGMPAVTIPGLMLKRECFSGAILPMVPGFGLVSATK